MEPRNFMGRESRDSQKQFWFFRIFLLKKIFFDFFFYELKTTVRAKKKRHLKVTTKKNGHLKVRDNIRAKKKLKWV
jgi:hypothetical protein